MHKDFDTLRKAAADLEEALRHYTGLYDIRNGVSDTSDEFHLDILPEAESLGITRYDLGSQVRHAFYGAEAQRVQRGIDEIKVMVRYPKADRENVNSLNNMFIRTPSGDEVPFETVAQPGSQTGPAEGHPHQLPARCGSYRRSQQARSRTGQGHQGRLRKMSFPSCRKSTRG